jgi:hypothetical protein
VRGPRLTLVSQPQGSALQCRLTVNCYFTAPAGYEDLVPRVIDRVGLVGGPRSVLDRTVTLEEHAQRSVMEAARNDPAGFRSGSLTLSAVRYGISESVDWDVPGGREIEATWPRPRGCRPTVLRDRRSGTLSRPILQEYRDRDATVLCWTVSSFYYVRPKGFLAGPE